MVRTAIDTAQDWAIGARNNLVAIRSGADRVDDQLSVQKARWDNSVGKAFRLFFGWDFDDGAKHIDKVDTRLRKLHDRIDGGLTVKCRPGSGFRSGKCDDSTAFQRFGWFAGDNINLCPIWFGKDADYRAAVIAHEVLHAIGGFGTVDLKNDRGQTVYGTPLALLFAQDEPTNARRNAENYEQFFTYRARHFTLPRTGVSGWTGVPEKPDAACMHPNGNAYFFKENKYYRFVPGSGVDKVGRIGVDGWGGLPTHLDAAVEHPNGAVYFFKGDKYYRYKFNPDNMDKVGRIGIDGWSGVKHPVQAAFRHPDTGDAWFFRDLHCQRFDFGPDKTTQGGVIHDRFPQLYGYVDTALFYPPQDKLYVFVTDRYTRISRGSLPR
ncbi:MULTISPECIES: hemopexin repeat-containing protein [unclassified Roseivivax]|uniref:hemopexin repeat-containing protein n=1 Tax=unclassified Roseivivax TaxID=2639302 RepID=UPI0012686F29|nr:MULTISPECIES: hemopexin repeat-containing protein [unclassified Roseivivax]